MVRSIDLYFDVPSTAQHLLAQVVFCLQSPEQLALDRYMQQLATHWSGMRGRPYKKVVQQGRVASETLYSCVLQQLIIFFGWLQL